MIKSMTGFGRSEFSNDKYSISFEVRSVNHRYMDLSVKLPRKLGFFEAKIRKVIKEYAQRGKVDVFLTFESFSGGEGALRCDFELAKKYLEDMNRLAEELGMDNDIRLSALARFPEVFSISESGIDEDELAVTLEKVFREAAANFNISRTKEGESLKADLLDKLQIMKKDVAKIEERAPFIIKEYQDKLRDKVSDFLENAQIDENRIVAEVTIYADKVAVDEELVRLNTHIAAMEKELLSDGAVGRKLDFIAQEMNREANTTLSKSTDIEITDYAIELKTLIEKIREQVQNLE